MISFIKTYGSNAFLVGLAVLLISAGSLGGALISQYGFGLHPCELCIYQRWPHGINIALGAIAMFLALASRPKTAAFFVFIGSLSFFIGTWIAGFHVGVEQRWWEGLKGCSFPTVPNGDYEAFKEALLNAPIASCKDIPFSFLGISMAGYNAILSFFSGIAALIGSILIMRRANNML